MRRAVEWLMRRALRQAFARVEWIGPPPHVPADCSVVLYANHHSFYDGYLLWLVTTKLLGRRTLTWMEDWYRFPLFAPIGALPFPADDARQRAGTIRGTARRFRDGPGWALVYFPEGHLHAPEDGVLPFDETLLRRLDGLLPQKVWLPVALYATWDGGAWPLVKMQAGTPHSTLTGDEHARLSALWHDLRTRREPSTLLFRGRQGPESRWDFRFAAPFFRRYL